MVTDSTAGMATGIGSAIAFFAKRTDYRFLSVATGFSAGVMLYVSFVEIFFKGQESLTQAYGDNWGNWINVASFFGGIGLIAVIDNLIPSAENPHETHTEQETAPLHDGDFDHDLTIECGGATDNSECDAGTVDAVFTVSLSGPNAVAMSVDYDTVVNTAVVGDFKDSPTIFLG